MTGILHLNRIALMNASTEVIVCTTFTALSLSQAYLTVLSKLLGPRLKPKHRALLRHVIHIADAACIGVVARLWDGGSSLVRICCNRPHPLCDKFRPLSCALTEFASSSWALIKAIQSYRMGGELKDPISWPNPPL